MYPQCADAHGKKQWTNRVLDLRALWSIRKPTTTMAETETALRIAKKCFPRFGAADMALMLLAFRNRPLKGAGLEDSGFAEDHAASQYGPVEVNRYRALLVKAEEIRKDDNGLFSDEDLLRKIYLCAEDE